MHDSVIDSTYVYEISKLDKIKSVFSNIIKFLGNLLFIFIVGIIIVTLIYGIYTKKNGTNGQAPLISAYVIITPSMVPTINVQDAVIAYKPSFEKLKKGDIITFRSTDARYTGLTVTHRIFRVVTDGESARSFKTKGDNNTTADDALVNKENIYGKVIFIIPWLGYLQYFLTKSYGWILLVVLPCIAIIIYDILKLTKVLKNSKITKEVKFKDIEVLDDFEDEVIDKSINNDLGSKVANDNVNEVGENNNIEDINDDIEML